MAKKAIRLVSFGMAAVMLLLGLLVHTDMRMREYRRRLQSGYMLALRQASGSLVDISAAMQKGLYAGTPAQVSENCARVARAAAAAQTAISALQADGAALGGAYTFLNQVEDYSLYLSRESVLGRRPTEKQWNDYEKLLMHAELLSRQILDIEYLAESGELDVDLLFRGGHDQADEDIRLAPAEKSVAASGEMPRGLPEYPTLIYDGPFSDALDKRIPEMTRLEPPVDAARARTIAADFAGMQPGELQEGTPEQSAMTSRRFYSGDLSVSVGVTVQGGMVADFQRDREIGPAKLTPAQALAAAQRYLRGAGFDSMTDTWHETANGICTFNFAFRHGDVICYPDLIKAGVALDNGEIVLFEARDYIASHRERYLPDPPLTELQARQSLSGRLEVTGARLALIPTPGGEEALVWEFLCRGRNRQTVLVYVNAQTGAEQEILILLEGENGALAV